MDTGTAGWMLASTALVLFMTPGLAFFYGGLVKAKSVVSMMMLSFGALGLIAVLWVLYGYNMGNMDLIPGLLGNPFSDFGLAAMSTSETANADLIGAAFGSTFAILTVALISGAIADRAKFWSWMIFAGIWATLSYFPVQGWVWIEGGWIYELGTNLGFDAEVIDWAGGTAVHINAGAAALALALVLGKRVGFQKGISQPHNVPLVILGAAILWFGWFGFNAGLGGLGDGGEAGLIVINTIAAPAAGVLGWAIVEKLKDGKATSIGAASGAVAGLVAITPACAALTPGWSIVLGIVTGAICALAIDLKFKLGYDDSLDVVGIHLVAGFIGCLYLGFFAIDTGLIFSGNLEQLIVQAISAVAVALYSFVVAFVVAFVIEKTMGFRVTSEDEVAGIDTALHGEEGYVLTDKV